MQKNRYVLDDDDALKKVGCRVIQIYVSIYMPLLVYMPIYLPMYLRSGPRVVYYTMGCVYICMWSCGGVIGAGSGSHWCLHLHLHYRARYVLSLVGLS